MFAAGCVAVEPRPLSGGDAAPKDLDELADPNVAAFGEEWLPMDQAGVELLAPQRVLEPLGDPVEDSGDHVGVDVVPHLSAPDPELDEVERSVGVLASHQSVDRPAEAKTRVMAADHRHPVWYPRLAQRLLREVDPVIENRPESAIDHVLRCIQPRGQLAHRAFECREEQPLLGSEVKEDCALGHAYLGRDVLHTRASVAVLGEMPHGDLDDQLAFGLRVRRALPGGHGGATVAAGPRPDKEWITRAGGGTNERTRGT